MKEEQKRSETKVRKPLEAYEIEALAAHSRDDLMAFSIWNQRDYDPAWFHKLIADKLMAVERGEVKRLMIFMPPRHGKSRLANVHFPAWYIGKHPDKEIVTTSYNADLATEFGYLVREEITGKPYRALFGVTLQEDSQSKQRMITKAGGSYSAIGVGGALTGKGADILLIDDPIKGRQDADSKLVRDITWQWYTSTAYTRLYKDSAIILIQCMTGDTPVLMSDGTEKPLRDLRPGDMVATYKNGSLTMARVKNWASNGIDNVFTIKTTSGKVVKANGRHPFLISNNGKPEWIRTKNLRQGQEMLLVNGESGKIKLAFGKAANSPLSAEATAPHTTERNAGLMAFDHHRITSSQSVKGILNTATESLWQSITSFLPSRMGSVLSASNHQERMSEPTGDGSSALTTATKQKKSGVFSVMTAIWQSVIQKQLTPLLPFPITSDFILDKIVSITPSGKEEVFDVEIEGTENFIANGLVSHNTRWHMDDMAGRLIEQMRIGGEQWDIINLPAIGTQDDLYKGKVMRHEGEALWSDQFNLKQLEDIKGVIGLYEFSSLYQQNPIASENQEFRPEWIQKITWDEVKKIKTRNFLCVDTAISRTDNADSTGLTINFVDEKNNWHFKAWKVRVNPKQLVDLLFQLHEEFNLEKIGIEETVYLLTIKPFFDEECRKRNRFPYVVPLKHHHTQKETRIRGLVPRYETKSIWHIEETCRDLEEEMIQFPKGKHDDVLDASAYQLQIAQQAFINNKVRVIPFKNTSFR